MVITTRSISGPVRSMTEGVTRVRTSPGGHNSVWGCSISNTEIPIVEIKRSYDRLISTMEFPKLVKRLHYIESWPCTCCPVLSYTDVTTWGNVCVVFDHRGTDESPERRWGATRNQGIVIGVSQSILMGLERNLVTAGSSWKTISHDRNEFGKTGQTSTGQIGQCVP